MELRIVQKFGVLDEFDGRHGIAQVEYTEAPEWLESLITEVDQNDVRLALDRYAVPLLLKIRYNPKQCLERVPPEHLQCTLWDGCFGWVPKQCMNYRTNTCELLRVPDAQGEHSVELTQIVNLWRDGYNVVRVAGKNG